MQRLTRVRGLGIAIDDSGSDLLQPRQWASSRGLPDRCAQSIRHELVESSAALLSRLSLGGR
eukprot:4487974-Amphidinium_carterae.1